MLKGLFSRKPKKLAYSELRAKELLRVTETEPDEGDELSFTRDEKYRLFKARDTLRNLPPTGKSGGVLQRVAAEVGSSRQYVHQVIFPKNPQKLFSSRNETYRKIWFLMEAKIMSIPMSTTYDRFFEELTSKGEVSAKIPKSKIRFLQKRAYQLAELQGKSIRVFQDNETIPSTYHFKLI